MNPKQTWWLVALAAGLFSYIYFVERPFDDTGQTGVMLPRLMPKLNPPAVTAVELVRSNDTIRVERVGETWRMSSPLKYPGFQAAIENLLSICSQLQPQVIVSAREVKSQPGGLADFGLDPPRATLTVKQGAEKLELRFGAKAPVGERLYVQVAGDDRVSVTDAKLLDLLPRTADDWRDTSLLGFNGIEFNRIEVRPHPPGFELQFSISNRLWRLTYPMAARADNPKVNYLLQLLAQWRVQQFVTDNPKVDLEPFGLQPPKAELAIGQGTNDLLVVQFGAQSTNQPGFVYARLLNHTNIVLASKEVFDVLLVPHTEFRDRRLLAFAPAAVQTVEIRGEENFNLLRQTNGVWSVGASSNIFADTALVNEFLNQLASLDAVEFVKDVVTDFTAYGLAKPAQQFVLHGTGTNAAGAVTNVVFAQLDIGKIYPPDKIYVRRTDENPVYAIPLAVARRLPQAVWQIRDRRVWNFAASDVVSVTVTQKGRNRKMLHNGENLWSLAPDSQGIINPPAVEETLHQLGELRAEVWTGRGEELPARYGFTADSLKIAVELKRANGTETVTLVFSDKAPPRGFNRYAAVVINGQTVIFEFPAKLYHELIAEYLAAP